MSTPHFIVNGKMKPGFLRSKGNIREYLDWLGEKRNNKSIECWYSLSHKELEDNHGGSLWGSRDSLFKKSGVCLKVLEYAYPEVDWLAWKFPNVPNGWFDAEENQKKWLAWFEKEKPITSVEQWYEATNAWFDHNGADTFLKRFNDSQQKLLMHHYPCLKPWLFNSGVPSNHWDDDENKREYLDWLGEKIGVINDLDDWYGVDQKALTKNGGGHLVTGHGPLYNIFSKAYKDHDWDDLRFSPHKAQVLMTRILRKEYGEVRHEWTADWLISSKNYSLKVDAYIEVFDLAIEYQGKQHGVVIAERGGKEGLDATQKRDILKKDLLEKNHVPLLYVPHTWDRTKDSLIALVEKKINSI